MKAEKRKELEARAIEIIRANPAYGRRKVAKELRTEYGVALRDATILSLQRKVFPYPKQHVEAVRAARLKKEGYLPFEYNQIKKQIFKNTGFMVKERKERSKDYKNFIAEMQAKGFKKRVITKEWRDKIIDRYQDEGWLLADGKLDPWQMFRDIRADAIKAGEWEDTPRYLKSHRKWRDKRDKGDVKSQRARFREKLQRSKN